MTPHPQRCETCQHAPVKRINKKYDNFETYRYFCKKYDMWIFGTAYNTIEITGCASHSSAPTEREPQCLCETCCMTVEQCRGQQLRQASPAPTEQDEREKVLDEVILLINKNCFELEGKRLKISPLLLLQELDELRTTPEAQG